VPGIVLARSSHHLCVAQQIQAALSCAFVMAPQQVHRDSGNSASLLQSQCTLLCSSGPSTPCFASSSGPKKPYFRHVVPISPKARGHGLGAVHDGTPALLLG
jgi:hypothetical protein